MVRIYEQGHKWVVEVSEEGSSFEWTFSFQDHAHSFRRWAGYSIEQASRRSSKDAAYARKI